MKKLSILILIASTLMLASCSFYGSGISQNHGLSTKKTSTISTIKGGSRIFCHGK